MTRAPAVQRRRDRGVSPKGARTVLADAPLSLIYMFASDLPEPGGLGLPLMSGYLARVVLSSFNYMSLLYLIPCSLFQLFFSLTIFRISTSLSLSSFRADAPLLSCLRLVTAPCSGCRCLRVHMDGSA